MPLSHILRVGSLVAYSSISQDDKDEMERKRVLTELKAEALNGGSKSFADFLNGGGFEKIKNNAVNPAQA